MGVNNPPKSIINAQYVKLFPKLFPKSLRFCSKLQKIFFSQKIKMKNFKIAKTAKIDQKSPKSTKIAQKRKEM